MYIDFQLANRRRSAHKLKREFDESQIKIIAKIGDYLFQREESETSKNKKLKSLKSDSEYKEFLESSGRGLTLYRIETAYLMQNNLIDGINPVRRIKQSYSPYQEKMAEISLNKQIKREQEPLLNGNLEEDLAKQLE